MRKDHLSLLKRIIRENIPGDEYIVFLFGSRAEQNHHDRSDIDIGILGSQPLSAILRYNLEKQIENSDIPYLVDIVDFSLVTENFKKEA